MIHLLDGCWAKLDRAEESIRTLDREAMAFFNTDPAPYKIVGEHKKGGFEYVFMAYGDPAVPLRFSVIAGEIVHHLRSSLDHLVHALVVKSGNSPTKRNQFPICSTRDNFESCQKEALKYVPTSARKLIMAVQPYTTTTPKNTVLHVIQEYDNRDKHNLLVVVTTVVQLGQEITIGVDDAIADSSERKGKTPAITGLGDPSPKKISKEGTEVFSIHLAEPAPEVFAKANVVPQLAFEQCGHVQLASTIQTLTGLLAGTRNTIKSFLAEF
jgi:hypothetical protein